MAGEFLATITADAFVVSAAALFLGFDPEVSWPGAACSIPATPVISVLGEALSMRAFRAFAMSASFMAVSGEIVSDGWLAMRGVLISRCGPSCARLGRTNASVPTFAT